MANEATLRDRLSHPIDFTVGNATSIEKGAFLKLVDARTASGAALIGAVCAGIAAREKVSGDGRTRLAVFRNGIFDVRASGAITVGEPVQMAENNDVMRAAANASGAVVIGSALETATDAEVIQIHLNIK